MGKKEPSKPVKGLIIAFQYTGAALIVLAFLLWLQGDWDTHLVMMLGIIGFILWLVHFYFIYIYPLDHPSRRFG